MCSFLWPFSILFIHLSYDFILSNFLPFYAFLIMVMLKPLLSFSFQPFFLFWSPLYKLALLIHLSPHLSLDLFFKIGEKGLHSTSLSWPTSHRVAIKRKENQNQKIELDQNIFIQLRNSVTFVTYLHTVWLYNWFLTKYPENIF